MQKKYLSLSASCQCGPQTNIVNLTSYPLYIAPETLLHTLKSFFALLARIDSAQKTHLLYEKRILHFTIKRLNDEGILKSQGRHYTMLQKKILKYTNHEYDHFLLKSEKKNSSVSDLQLKIVCSSMYFWTRNPKKALEIPYHAYFLRFHFEQKNFCPKQKR